MALTLSYAITSLKVKDEVNADGVTLQNAVCQTYWKCTGTDEDGNTGEFQGATPFSAATVSEGDFKAFEDLVEADVIGWVQAVVDGDPHYREHIEGQIQRQIDELSIRQPNMPWAEDVTPPLPVDAPGADESPADPVDPEA
jgi:hypothetical protein